MKPATKNRIGEAIEDAAQYALVVISACALYGILYNWLHTSGNIALLIAIIYVIRAYK